MQSTTTHGGTRQPVATSGHVDYNVSTNNSDDEYLGEEPYYFQISYNYKVRLGPNGEVINTDCECPAGKGPCGTCKHVAAILLVLVQFIETGRLAIQGSCTEQLQTFHKPKKNYQGSPVKAEDIESSYDINMDDPRPERYRGNAGYNAFVKTQVINYCAASSKDLAFRYLMPKANIQVAARDHDYSTLPITEHWVDAGNKTERIIFDSCIFAAIVIGNLVVLLAVWISRKKRRSRMTFFIQQLAIADLLVGLFSVLPDLLLMVDGRWGGGDPVCKIVKYLQGVVTYGSTYMLVALSVDRWDAVARPIDGITNANFRCKVLTVSAWTVAALFSLPMFLFEDNQGECIISYFEDWHWQLYLVLIALAVFIIPTIIIICCYGAIIHILLQKTFECTEVKSKGERGDVSPKNGYKPHKPNRIFQKGKRRNMSRSSRGIIPQAKIRTIKMTTVIVIVFILCWSPYFVVNLVAVFGHLDHRNHLVNGFYAFIQSLAPLNSALNPVIYGIFSSRTCHHLITFSYRGQLRKMCPCCRRCLKEPSMLIPRWSHTDVSYSTCRQTITPDKSIDIIKPSDSTELCDLIVTNDMLEEHSRR